MHRGREKMKAHVLLFSIVICLVLPSCGGGGGSSSPTTPTGSTPTPPSAANGTTYAVTCTTNSGTCSCPGSPVTSGSPTTCTVTPGSGYQTASATTTCPTSSFTSSSSVTSLIGNTFTAGPITAPCSVTFTEVTTQNNNCTYNDDNELIEPINGNWFSNFGVCGAQNDPSSFSLNCDGMAVNYGECSSGYCPFVGTQAANPNGLDTMGYGEFIGTGTNENSGSLQICLPPAPHFWFRWYQYYCTATSGPGSNNGGCAFTGTGSTVPSSSGITWSNYHYEKIIYFWTANDTEPSGIFEMSGDDTTDDIIYMDYDNYSNEVSSNGQVHNGSTGIFSWNAVNAAPLEMADGNWHEYQIYVKSTGNNNTGTATMWMDGTVILNYTNINFGTAGGGSFNCFGFNTNQDTIATGGWTFVTDLDMFIPQDGCAGSSCLPPGAVYDTNGFAMIPGLTSSP